MLLYFGLDCGVLDYSRAVIQRTIDVSPTFLEQDSAEKIQWYHSHADPTGRTVPLREEISYREEADTEIMMQLSVQSLE
jgi:hypothetical protein